MNETESLGNLIVCPFCQTGFRIKEKCPQCCNEFNAADWPVKAVYLPVGKIARLTVSWDDTNTWSPVATDFFIGREPGLNGLQINGGHVSRKHAHVFLRNGCWIIESLEKEKEVYVNETALSDFPNSSVELVSGDKITIDAFQLKIRVEYTADFTFSHELESEQTEKQDIVLSRDNPVHIGSNESKCLLVIPHASPDHAAVYYHKPSKSWWIADLHSGSGTRVNGSPVCNERLIHGDKITIGETDILFDSEYLRIGCNPNSGVDVSICDVTVSRDNRDILSHINMEVHAGDFVGLLGPSGCGKSSLIQRLAGLGSFDSGDVKINGISYESRKSAIQSITAYVPQDVALHDDLTLEEEISIFCRLHFKDICIDHQVQNALRLVGLEGKRGHRIGTLSGGEKRRASIALELLREPQLFILDEPTAGLDPATETDIMKYLRRVANQNRTVICSTHIMGNIRLFDKILFLSQGKEIFYGTPSELLARFDTDSPLKIYQIFGKEDTASGRQDAKNTKQRKRENQFFNLIYKLRSLSNLIMTQSFSKDNGNDSNSNLSRSSASANIIQQISGYLQRQFLDYFSFRHQKEWKEKFISFIFSPFFIHILLLPFLVAFVLKTACAENFYYDAQDLFFFSAIAVFWFGLNTHIRELVQERVPWRCLERLEHISLFSYLSSKIIWTLFVSFVQVFLFLLGYALFHWLAESLFNIGREIANRNWFARFLREFLMSFRLSDKDTVESSNMGLVFNFSYAVILYSCCVLGSWISLAISSIFKKENSAVGLLPIILIPFLFFSNPIVKDVDRFGNDVLPAEENKRSCTFACHTERISPLYAAQLLMDNIKNATKYEVKTSPDKNSKNKNEKEKRKRKNFFSFVWHWFLRTSSGHMFLLTTGVYMLFALGLMIWFQHKNEQEWEGR